MKEETLIELTEFTEEEKRGFLTKGTKVDEGALRKREILTEFTELTEEEKRGRGSHKGHKGREEILFVGTEERALGLSPFLIPGK